MSAPVRRKTGQWRVRRQHSMRMVHLQALKITVCWQQSCLSITCSVSSPVTCACQHVQHGRNLDCYVAGTCRLPHLPLPAADRQALPAGGLARAAAEPSDAAVCPHGHALPAAHVRHLQGELVGAGIQQVLKPTGASEHVLGPVLPCCPPKVWQAGETHRSRGACKAGWSGMPVALPSRQSGCCVPCRGL